MPVICLLLSAVFVGLYVVSTGDRVLIGSYALPVSPVIFLFIGLGFLTCMVWFWRRKIWTALRYVIDTLIWV